MRLIRGRCRRLLAVWLCMASVLLTAACTAPGTGQNSVTLVAPAPADSALTIFAAHETKLVAYRARDGSTRWTYTLKSEDYDLDYGLMYGDGLVLGFTFSGSQPDHLTLVAVDAANGHLRWRVRVAGLSAPQVAIASDYVVLELGTQGSPGPLRVIRASDGGLAHDIPLAGAGWIAADGDTAFECDYDAVLTAFRLDDGQPRWTVPVAPGSAVPGEGCSLRADGGIVFGSVIIPTPTGQRMNELVAVRERDGQQLWQKPLGLGALKYGVGYFFVESASSPGQLPSWSLVAYRTADGARLWQIPVGAAYSSNIAGDGNALVFRQGLDIRAVRASDGATLWRYAPSANHMLGVVDVADGLVFALSTGNWSIHNLPPPGTDTRQYLLVLGADNGRLYWQMPLDLSNIVIGGASGGTPTPGI